MATVYCDDDMLILAHILEAKTDSEMGVFPKSC